MTELRVLALAPVLDLVVSKVVEPGDMLTVTIYGHVLGPVEIERAGVVDRVIVVSGGGIIPLYEGEDGE